LQAERCPVAAFPMPNLNASGSQPLRVQRGVRPRVPHLPHTAFSWHVPLQPGYPPPWDFGISTISPLTPTSLRLAHLDATYCLHARDRLLLVKGELKP
jgi:hypothetical protein